MICPEDGLVLVVKPKALVEDIEVWDPGFAPNEDVTEDFAALLPPVCPPVVQADEDEVRVGKKTEPPLDVHHKSCRS
jgi:hypothetical protein